MGWCTVGGESGEEVSGTVQTRRPWLMILFKDDENVRPRLVMIEDDDERRNFNYVRLMCRYSTPSDAADRHCYSSKRR